MTAMAAWRSYQKMRVEVSRSDAENGVAHYSQILFVFQ
jgi:hypothetical protein